jgi:hypothetical protein
MHNDVPLRMIQGYNTSVTDLSVLLKHNDREVGTQLRSTGPRSARPCWIDGPQQLGSSDELACTIALLAGRRSGNQTSIYTAVDVDDVNKIKTSASNSLGERVAVRSHRSSLCLTEQDELIINQ